MQDATPAGETDKMPSIAFRAFWPVERDNRLFAEAGYRLVHIYPANTINSLGLPYCKYPPNWTGPDRYDWSSVDRQIADILKWNPGATLLVMIDLNTPPWWIERHGGADSFRKLGQVALHEDYRREAAAYLQAFLRHTETHHRQHIASYMLSCGWTCEWYDMSRGEPTPARRDAFREWSGNPEAEIPQDRYTPSHPPFYDPQADAETIAYWQFSTSVVTDWLLEAARKAQEILRHRAPLGVFYGYVLELGRNRLMYEGHLDYEKVFDSPELDFLVSPTSYQDRWAGGGGGLMLCVDSLRLHGKVGWIEADHRTHLINRSETSNPARWRCYPTENETVAILRREFAMCLISGQRLWWFDMFGGWFDSPRLMAELGRMREISDALAAKSRSHAEIALFVDEESMWCLDSRSPYASLVLPAQRAGLSRMGAPYEIYSLRDLPKLDVSRFKMVLLPNCFVLTDEKRRWLEEKLFCNGRHVVWGFASGIITDGRYDPANIGRLTGVAVESLPPLSAPLVVKRQARDGWTSIYTSRPNLPSATLQTLAREAGVHLYTETPEPLYANETLVAVHTREGGRRTVRLPRPARVVELFENREVASQPVEAFTETLPPMSTRLYRLSREDASE